MEICKDLRSLAGLEGLDQSRVILLGGISMIEVPSLAEF